MLDQVKQMLSLMSSAKAYVATLVALGGILLTLSADENFQSLGIPETAVGKMAGVGTLLVAFGAVFGVRNVRSVEQAQEDLERARNRAAPSPRKRVTKPRAKKRAAPKKVAAQEESDTAPPPH